MTNNPAWSESNSQTFLDYGRYFVPEREGQIETICGLIPPSSTGAVIVELCCGEGLLAHAILECFPGCVVRGLDGSSEMLAASGKRLAGFGDRFQTQHFDLASIGWRSAIRDAHVVVSSLAIHHLDGPEKQALFVDVYGMLSLGGVFVIADVIAPAGSQAESVAADAWDWAVRQRSLELDGNLDGFGLFQREHWNMYRYFDPDDIDKPSPLYAQLQWLEMAGFVDVDVYWMQAGHAIFGGRREG
jgi:tRNA (cmo5U34)-methyltransferase